MEIRKGLCVQSHLAVSGFFDGYARITRLQTRTGDLTVLLADVDADVPPTELLGRYAGGAGATEGVEDDIIEFAVIFNTPNHQRQGLSCRMPIFIANPIMSETF